MKHKTSIVTGSYGAIGKAIARGLAEKGYKVVLVGRNEAKLREAAEEITKKTGNDKIEFSAVDLCKKSDIEAFAKKWDSPLHLLINNAATTPRSREETPEGIEMQFAANVLGYFWMKQYFYPFMEEQDDARIVNVASYWAGGLDLSDVETRKGIYDNDDVYRKCKQANRMLSVAFAEKLKNKNISVLACHPGDVRSKLSSDLGHGGWESPQQGADTPLWCATAPELKNVTGKYYEHRTEVKCRFATDEKAVEKLFAICQEY